MTEEGWISVVDRLPESRQRVLTWNPTAWREDYCLGIHIYHVDYARTFTDWWIGSENYIVDCGVITHWMPLIDGPRSIQDQTND